MQCVLGGQGTSLSTIRQTPTNFSTSDMTKNKTQSLIGGRPVFNPQDHHTHSIKYPHCLLFIGLNINVKVHFQFRSTLGLSICSQINFEDN